MKCPACVRDVVQPVRVCGISRCPWCGENLGIVLDEMVHEEFEKVATIIGEDELTKTLIVRAGGDPEDEIWQEIVGDIVEEQKWLWIEKHLGVDTKIKYIEGYITWEDCISMVVENEEA